MTKVMLLVAVSQPLIDVKRVKYFNGKLGCFPLVEVVEAKRNRNKSQT